MQRGRVWRVQNQIPIEDIKMARTKIIALYCTKACKCVFLFYHFSVIRVGPISCVLDHEICFDLKMHCNAFGGLVLLGPTVELSALPRPPVGLRMRDMGRGE